MAVPEELKIVIENEAAALTKKQFRRPSMSINKFIGEFSALLAQADEDKEKLIVSGFNWSRMPLFTALFETLNLAYGERIGTMLEVPEKRALFDQNMALANSDRRRLGIVATHIVEKSKSRKAAQVYRYIAKGSGIVDTLTDNLGLVTLIREFAQIAFEIRPGGKEITPEYLDEVCSRALELLQLKGFVIEKGVPKNSAVDRQNRLLTLAMDAQSYIRKYAYAAFFEDIEYYNSNYASESRKADIEPADETADDEVEEPVAETVS